MRKFLTGLSIILVLGVATLAHGDVVDIMQFGQCAAQTEVDDFTDEKSPQLVCAGKGDNLGSHVVVLTCLPQKFGTLLLAGAQLHMNETIDVLYRFDKGKLGKGSWRYDDSIAVSFDKAVHGRFVEGIEKAKKVFFKVGDKASSVDLTGSAGAMTEYKKRCSALGRPIK
jgi:hypothetical protein